MEALDFGKAFGGSFITRYLPAFIGTLDAVDVLNSIFIMAFRMKFCLSHVTDESPESLSC